MKRLALLALLLLAGGCAGAPEKAVLRLGLDATTETRRLMWPPEKTGEVPRYFYAGELTGENNFVRPQEPKASQNIVARFFGLIVGEEPPLLLDRPQAGTVDAGGRILVTDLGRAAVFVFDDKAGKLSVWDKAAGTADFVSPVGIAADAEGRVFVADAELGMVARLDRDGNPLTPIGKGLLRRPTGLAYEAKTGRLFVADTQAHQIKVFSGDGTLLSTIGGHGEGPGQFNYPTHIALQNDKLYVTDTLNARIQVLSAQTGGHLGSVGKRGLYLGNLVRPKGVAADSEHNIYVVESNHDYLLVYNRRGEFLLPIGGVGTGAGKFHLPAGVWVDARNRIFVADSLNSRVAVFQFLGGDSSED